MRTEILQERKEKLKMFVSDDSDHKGGTVEPDFEECYDGQ